MKQNRRIAHLPALLLAAALALAACGEAPAEDTGRLDKTKAVVDEANVLSADTEEYITNLSTALQEGCGAQIGVYTVEYIGNTTMEAYAYSLANEWGLGDKDKDNGILLLLAVGEDDYWVTPGAGLESQLSAETLSSLLYEQMEPSWLHKDYDTGTRNTVRALGEQLCRFYGLTLDLNAVAAGTAGSTGAPARREGGGTLLRAVLVLCAVVLLIWLISLLLRPRRRAAPRRTSGLGTGLFVGYSLGRRRRRPPPPPPPPPPPRGGYGGYGGPPPRGPARTPPPRSSAPRPPARPGGTFHTGGAGRSGGAPRPSAPRGSFKAGGGSFRGGGAGRRH